MPKIQRKGGPRVAPRFDSLDAIVERDSMELSRWNLGYSFWIGELPKVNLQGEPIIWPREPICWPTWADLFTVYTQLRDAYLARYWERWPERGEPGIERLLRAWKADGEAGIDRVQATIAEETKAEQKRLYAALIA
jgi:hypothetical protein